jgi:hypothetical protein
MGSTHLASLLSWEQKLKLKLQRLSILLSLLFFSGLALQSVLMQGHMETWEIIPAISFAFPVALLLRDMAFFPWPYNLIGGERTLSWPEGENALMRTPQFRARPNFVAVGPILSNAMALSPWSTLGIHLVLFPSGIGFSAFGKAAFVKASSIREIKKISSKPRLFYIEHSTPELRSPIGFSDQAFFEAAIRTVKKTRVKDG